MASGDLRYQVTLEGELTNAQRAALATFLPTTLGIWPNAVGALSQVKFARRADNTVVYQLTGTETKAPADVPIGATIVGRVP